MSKLAHPDDEHWGYKELADFLKCPRGTVYAKVSRRELPHYRISGRMVRFKKSEILAWMQERQVQSK